MQSRTGAPHIIYKCVWIHGQALVRSGKDLVWVHDALRVEQLLDLPHQRDARLVFGVVQRMRLHHANTMLCRHGAVV